MTNITMEYDVLDIRKRKGLLWKLPSFIVDAYYNWDVIVQLENNEKVIIHIESSDESPHLVNEDDRDYLYRLAIKRELEKQYRGIEFKEKSFVAKIPLRETSNKAKELLK